MKILHYFNACVQKAKYLEQLSSDAQEIKLDSKMQETFKLSQRQHENYTANFSLKNYVCVRCGAKDTHEAKNCFAIKMQCRKCLKIGHLAKVCKARKLHHVDSYTPTSSANHETAELSEPISAVPGRDDCHLHSHLHSGARLGQCTAAPVHTDVHPCQHTSLRSPMQRTQPCTPSSSAHTTWQTTQACGPSQQYCMYGHNTGPDNYNDSFLE